MNELEEILTGPGKLSGVSRNGPQKPKRVKGEKKKVNARGETNLRNNVYNWGLRIKGYKSVCYLSGEREYKLASF